MYWQSLSQWCLTTNRRSYQYASRIRINDSHHAVLLHASNRIILPSDLLHRFESWHIANSMLSKWRRMCWIHHGEVIGIYASKTSGWITMPYIARQKHWKALHLCHSACRWHVQLLLRNRVSNGSRFGLQKLVRSVPDPYMNLTRWLLVSQIQTDTAELADFAAIG